MSTDIYAHILAFREAMESHGLFFKGELIADGTIQRVHCEGDSNGSRNMWFLLHLDGRPAGAFGCWKKFGREKFTWVADRGATPMTAEERAALRAKIEADEARRAAEQQAKHDDAAARAQAIWDAAVPAPDTHPYLRKKGVQAYGIRVGEWSVDGEPDPGTGEVPVAIVKNALIIPLVDRKDHITSLQGIFPSDKNKLRRGKDYFQDGKKKGCYFTIGGRPTVVNGVMTFLFCEGYSTGASLHAATGMFVVVCFDASNILPVAQLFRGNFPDARFVIAADNDQWTEKPIANPGVHHARKAAEAVAGILAIPEFKSLTTKPTDFNDLAANEDMAEVNFQIRRAITPPAAVEEHAPLPVVVPAPERKDISGLFSGPPPQVDESNVRDVAIVPTIIRLQIGSDVEIARHFADALTRHFGPVIFAEGQFWAYRSTHWASLDPVIIRRAVYGYDGVIVENSKVTIKLGRAKLDSILNETGVILSDSKFFAGAHIGINCASGFLSFSTAGELSIVPHDPEHRCRHVLPGHWEATKDLTLPQGSLLHRLLSGAFQGDADATAKVMALGEIAGAAALGHRMNLFKPKAAIFIGESADNGKSQILDLYRGLLPASAISAVSPGTMGDKHQIIGLAGKLLNARDELASANAISSEIFKAAVTGEPIEGRDLYKSRTEFRAIAQHVYATNQLPSFSGGMDRGVQRRLLVIPFNRSIPKDEQVEGIGRRIAEEEPDLLLAWAIDGAKRLIRQRAFTVADSSKIALRDWLFDDDAVLAWASVRVKSSADGNSARVRTAYAYAEFRSWATGEGFEVKAIPGINGFVQRITSHFKSARTGRTATERYLEGITIATDTQHPFSDASMTGTYH